MKKLFIFMGALLLGVGAFGIKGNKPLPVKASLTDEQTTNLKNMMEKYIDTSGQYTKKSRSYLKTSTPDFATYFHAGETRQERTTYYDDDVLLMGDLDGGFSSINSGYANSGSDMVHFRSEDGVNAINLADRRSIDYTVAGKQMSDYFFDLHDLVDSIQAGEWGYNAGLYYHDITTLGLDEHNEFKDPLLKKFQYFAAPMLLQTANHYLSYKSITINEDSGYLHICIYLSDSDSGKVDSGSNLLAEAMVYAGLTKPGYYLVGNYNSDKYDWQICTGRPLAAPTEGTDHGQLLNAMLPDKKYQVCQLKADGKTEWLHNVPEIANYAYAEMDGNDIHIKYGGTYSIYLNASDEIYIFRVDHKTATFKFTFVDSDWSDWNPRPENFHLHATTSQNGTLGTWGSDDEKMTKNGDVYTISLDFNGFFNGFWFYFYQDGAEKKTNNFIGLTSPQDGETYNILCDVANFVWTNGEITGGVSFSLAA